MDITKLVPLLVYSADDAQRVMAAPRGAAAPVAAPPVFREVALTLTAQETAMFAVLTDAAVAAGKGTTVRVAGGWVRDKVLGLPSNDIDVCVDTVSGVEFAETVNAHLKARGEATSSVGVIQANPLQSKHLETAATRVLGEWVDFVGLRAEVYDEASRIPEVTPGTPLQDAMRRDFTLNALFYNVTRNCVEDFSGRGAEDLAARVLRTPLPPVVTLRDDPLRVMRAVRFAARFGLRMEDALKDAIVNPALAEDLATKVSRERVGIELEGMVAGKAPALALRTLHCARLSRVVFALPPPGTTPVTPTATPSSAGGGGGGKRGDGRASPSRPSATTDGTLFLPPCAPPPLPPFIPFAPFSAPPTVTAADSLPQEWGGAGQACVDALEWAAGTLGGDGLRSLLCVDGVGDAPRLPAPLLPACCALGFRGDSARAAVGEAAAWEAAAAASAALRSAFSDENQRRLLFLSAALLPLARAARVKSGGTKREPLAFVVLLEGVKRPGKDGDLVVALHSGAVGFSSLLVAGEEGGGGGGGGGRAAASAAAAAAAALRGPPAPPPHCAGALLAARQLGAVLRRDTKEHWRASLLLSLAYALVPVLLHPSADDACRAAAAQAVVDAHHGLALRAAGPWELDRCWERKPLLTGPDVLARALGCDRKQLFGPAIGAIMEEQSAWMSAHPRGDADAAAAHLRAFASEQGLVKT